MISPGTASLGSFSCASSIGVSSHAADGHINRGEKCLNGVIGSVLRNDDIVLPRHLKYLSIRNNASKSASGSIIQHGVSDAPTFAQAIGTIQNRFSQIN